MPANPTVDPNSNDRYYLASDPKDEDFGIMGTLRDGVLRFLVEANRHKGSLSGTEFFNAMMEHFDPVNVMIIVGDWTDSDPTLTANLNTFNARTSIGDSAIVAASQTWTGQRAADWDYTEIEILRLLPP